jgi:hypothetical protein
VAFWLRQVLPLAFGLSIAGLPGAERCLELQLSLPTPITRTLARRAGLCGLLSALWVLCLTVVAGAAGVWQPSHGLLAGQLTWLSPTVALAGVCAAVFVSSGSTTGAAAAVAGLWLFEDLTIQWFTNRTWLRPWYLFVDDAPGALRGWWWADRLALLAVGALLLALAPIGLHLQRERVIVTRLRNQSEE